jgi:FtsZ-binding cell division protein ZapB
MNKPVKITASAILLNKEHYDSLIAERNAFLDEVEAYKEKEKICTDCEAHPEYLRLKKENEQLQKDKEYWHNKWSEQIVLAKSLK